METLESLYETIIAFKWYHRYDLRSPKIKVPNTATRANYVNIHVKYDRRAKLLWSLLCFWQIAGNFRV